MPTGKLIVQTRAARGAVPVMGAAVTVYCPDDTNVMQPCVTVRTDTSGSTEAIELEAPSLANMDVQEVPPFASFRVDIDHPDYRPVTVTDVPVYAGITTTLPVTMIPPSSLTELNQRITIRNPKTGPTGSGTES